MRLTERQIRRVVRRILEADENALTPAKKNMMDVIPKNFNTIDYEFYEKTIRSLVSKLYDKVKAGLQEIGRPGDLDLMMGSVEIADGEHDEVMEKRIEVIKREAGPLISAIQRLIDSKRGNLLDSLDLSDSPEFARKMKLEFEGHSFPFLGRWSVRPNDPGAVERMLLVLLACDDSFFNNTPNPSYRGTKPYNTMVRDNAIDNYVGHILGFFFPISSMVDAISTEKRVAVSTNDFIRFLFSSSVKISAEDEANNFILDRALWHDHFERSKNITQAIGLDDVPYNDPRRSGLARLHQYLTQISLVIYLTQVGMNIHPNLVASIEKDRKIVKDELGIDLPSLDNSKMRTLTQNDVFDDFLYQINREKEKSRETVLSDDDGG
jgi:hypothetical protein